MTAGPALPPMAIVRRHVHVRGVVQGVGFRPFAHALAGRFGVGGHVGNDGAGVFLELEGEESRVDAFLEAMRVEAPPLARIESVHAVALAPRGETAFRILASAATPGAVTPVAADVAPCADCLRELEDPADRRYRYPFINCTNCGPRYSIVRDVPYDRPNTTMAGFVMCEACQREYDAPDNRRFHAQPNACPTCGPTLAWHRIDVPDAAHRVGEAAMREALAMLTRGGTVAVKGVGGFHLACDATREDAVARLRARKQRAEKPLALLVADVATARRFATVSPAEATLLQAPERPIVLLARCTAPDHPLAPSVAPGQSTLGVMLPPSPLHHLLAAFGPLVLTSGNLSEEPIARDNDEALTRLAPIVDGFLMHDRPIHVVCDDSVVRVHEEGELPIRRSRGYAPYPVRLPHAVPSILAVGAELKATACLTRDRYAFLTPHIGDLGNLETMEAMARACDHLERLFRVRPARIACDLHPGYRSTQWARTIAAERGLPVVAVQHHHAHLAALFTEHALAPDEPLLAFVFDGTGYGTDGTIWGGEVLLGDVRRRRPGRAPRHDPLPGGDSAVRHPARVALAQLWAAGYDWDGTASAAALGVTERRILRTQLERRINCATTSSMGRFLDAAASLAGVRQAVSYEGQAAIEFEALALAGADGDGDYSFPLSGGGSAPVVFDGAHVLQRVATDRARGRSPRDIARAVHDALAACIVAVADAVRAARGVNRVGLTGGVFQNVLLLSLATARLRAAGFTVYTHHRVPPNDGGLALGQAMVAAATEDVS
ncbi:MAG: carbamoyltransferase HypF [Gemmatimonadetes bacterium]|nr:carbamoyltransferase HypF [Gemmatimonadota bacterium]